MKIQYNKSATFDKGIFLIPFFQTETQIKINEVVLSSKMFSGKKDTSYIFENQNNTIICIGLGKNPDYNTIKTSFRRISKKQETYFETKATIVFDDEFLDDQIEASILGFVLGSYKLDHYKQDKKQHPILNDNFELVIVSKPESQKPVKKAISIASAQIETMKLVDLPSNEVTPTYLANWAFQAAKKYNFSVNVFDKKEALAQGLHAFLAVGQGSQHEPQFIILEYQPKNPKKHIGLVGKGVTFDTGGLNIKTAGMVHMKCDMAGGAAVLGAMQLIADLQLPYQVTAIVPACENAVDAKSFLPSDVIQSYAGHSIEIIDTDAEGRLILADGLSYLIKNYKPEIVIDIATLTGGAVGTFGYECAALFSNNPEISIKIQETGDAIGERSWPLPLWDSYKTDIESEIADVKNFSGKPVAGAISAAKFLEFFTDKHTSWAHLDVAGVAFGDSEFAKTKHASAFGVHLISKFIENL